MGHRTIELSNQADIRAHQATLRKQIREAYGADTKDVLLITKAEFEEQFTAATHDLFPIEKLHAFRQDLTKADPTAGEETFRKAVADLRGYVVEGDGKRTIVYVGEKKQKTE